MRFSHRTYGLSAAGLLAVGLLALAGCSDWSPWSSAPTPTSAGPVIANPPLPVAKPVVHGGGHFKFKKKKVAKKCSNGTVTVVVHCPDGTTKTIQVACGPS